MTAAPRPTIRWTPERVAELVRLREQEKWTWAQIGAHFGISRKNALVTYNRKHVYPNQLPIPRNDKLSETMRDKLVAKLLHDIGVLKGQVNRLLDHCPDPECPTCAEILSMSEENNNDKRPRKTQWTAQQVAGA